MQRVASAAQPVISERSGEILKTTPNPGDGGRNRPRISHFDP
jgi:hypothetical protein